jgi:hypothetical protein
MKFCSNKHMNLDTGNFCEICGEDLNSVKDPSEPVEGGVIGIDEVDLSSDGGEDVSSDFNLESTSSPLADGEAKDSDSGLASLDDEHEDSDDDDINANDSQEDQADNDTSDLASIGDDLVATSLVDAFTGVAAELKTWSSTWNLTDDPYVQGLQQAALTNNELGFWSSVDPAQMLPDLPTRRTRLHSIGNAFAVLRNVLVFTPVALTWLAIYRATSAYSEWDGELAQNVASGVRQKNFLDFWANGYGILDKKYTLPEIGKVDFLLILLVILLSLISSVLVSRGDSLSERERSKFEHSRAEMAVRIRRALHGKREASPASIASSLADALADLNQTTRDLSEVASRMESSSVGVTSLTPQIEKLNVHIGTMSTQTAQAVEQLIISIGALNGSVSGNITTAFQTAVASLQEAGEQLARTSASVEYGTKLLKDDIDAIRSSLRR